MMKRLLPLIFLCLMLTLPQTFAVSASEEDAHEVLTVGNTTQMKGDFFTDLWGNASSDLDVRMLLHGYGLVSWDSAESLYVANPTVVTGMVVTEHPNKDRTFRISLYDDLRYSDGTKITAWDYAFSALLEASGQMSKIGGNAGSLCYLKGFDAYHSGASAYLAGVEVTDPYELKITVSHEYLPYFYELTLIDFQPYPIHVIAPGCTVKDDGNGAYITGPFSETLLTETILDPEKGYRSHPSVVSGPYMLTSFDGKTAEFAINPYYKGDNDGNLPSINHLIYTVADNADMITQLEDGSFDLLNKVANMDAIQEGMALVSGDSAFSMGTYPRSGLGFIAFHAAEGALSDLRIRQAIAWAFDRASFVREYCGSFGLEVSGYYGIGQWMYSVINHSSPRPAADDETPEDIAGWNALSLDKVESYTGGDAEEDLAKARELLEQYRQENGEDALRFVLGYPKGNTASTQLESYFAAPLAGLGIEVELKEMEMPLLLAEYYGQTESTCDMLYLASNFDVTFDPVSFFETEGDAHCWNYTGIEDQQLYALAKAVAGTQPGDTLRYCENWVAFQERFSQVLPVLPIYSGVYFDFYTSQLHGYEPAASLTWTMDILGAYLSDVPAANADTSSEPEFLDNP